jgi:hypothetical protein
MVSEAASPSAFSNERTRGNENGFLEFVDGAVSNVLTTTENASSYSIRRERSLCECRRLDDLRQTAIMECAMRLVNGWPLSMTIVFLTGHGSKKSLE